MTYVYTYVMDLIYCFDYGFPINCFYFYNQGCVITLTSTCKLYSNHTGDACKTAVLHAEGLAIPTWCICSYTGYTKAGHSVACITSIVSSWLFK